MPADAYKFDEHRVYEVTGRARNAAFEQRSEEPVPDPPTRGGSYGRVITRSVGRENLPIVSEPEIEKEHKGFCQKCQGIMLGSGSALKIMTEDGRQIDEIYSHLPRHLLGHNATIGCSLCGVILEELRQRVPDSEVGDEEKNCVGYAYGSFLDGGKPNDGEDPKTFALLIYEFIDNERHEVVLSLQSIAGQTTFRVSPSLERPTTAAGVLAGRMWLEQCNKGHSCMASASASRDCHFVPKRLIYVDEDDSGIRLATSDVPTGAAYMSLSHCWGDAAAHGAYSLTSTRLDGYRRSIPVEKLPRTFVEAIQITRALGQKYLWIDSLCIIQDSKDDWAEQAADMWQIYTNSYLNISATASKNPDEGLFYRRPEKSQLPGFLHVGKDHPEYPRGDYRLYSESRWRRQVTNALVNSRAWVLQERVLAPRILHFASREVFWECNCLRASESYPEGIPPLMDCQDTITIKSEKTDNEDSSIPHYSLLRTWSSVVERYSELHLTFSSDKLVALSALPHQVSVTFPDAGTYLAGLWKGPLAAQLLWKSRTPRSARRSETYLAPSWSWACINGAIDPNFDYSGYEPYGNKSVSRPMLRILDAQTVTSASSRQFGAIKSAELKVAGCLLKVRLRERQKRPETERVTPLEQREQWTKLMATVIPGYTGDDMKLISNSIPESFSGTNLGIDAVNGILCTDESSGWFDGDSFGPRVTVGENLTVAVTLDAESETAALVGVDLFLLPVSCISANNRPYNRESYNIHSLGCLVLAREEIGGGDHLGRYRRVGMCELEDGAALCALLCGLGNQEDGEVTSEGLHPGSLALEDFVPETWPCKELEFIPRSYKLFQITIV